MNMTRQILPGIAILLLALTSCKDTMQKIVKAPAPFIETVVVGHEQFYTVQAILRLAVRHADPAGEVSDVRRYYPDASETELRDMFYGEDNSYYRRRPSVLF